MKIGFMANYFYPATGGMEELTFNIAKELKKRGHEIHIFTSDRKENNIFKKEETIDGIYFHRSRLFFKYKYYLKFNPGLSFKHLKYNLDVLHVQSIGFPFQDLAVLLRRIFTKTKLINTPHGPFMALDTYPWWQKVLRDIYRTLEYPINLLYHKSVQVNPTQYQWMNKFGLKNIKFIPNSIPESIFKRVKPQITNKFIISYLGRVQKYKGMDQVIRVLPDLIKIQPNIQFLIMGNEVDNEINRLTNIAKELGVENHIKFTGRVGETERLQYLDLTEIFILPSEWEAFGIVLIEAMARSCALVSTKTEGGSFLISEKEGFLYDYKNLEQLKQALTKLIKNTELREQIKEHNKEKAKQYLVSNVVKDFEKLYLK
ncbi:MAG: glycosyltransferase family 4 protein [archaeon]